MKTKFAMRMAALCALLSVAAAAANSPTQPDAAGAAPATKATSVATQSDSAGSTKAKPASASLPPALAAEKAAEEAIRAHIKPSRELKMKTPPPAPRTETKSAPPAENHVWVPGHWAPQDGEWKWVAGQWSVPATPVSVWIEGKYDPAAKRWSPGYWQPDRPDSYENESPVKETAAPANK